MNKLQCLLDAVVRKSDALREAESLYSCQLAPNFSIFNFINTDELGISKILADLLNPKGTHGQNELFLKLFIQYCLPEVDIEDNWQAYIKDAYQTNVSTEVITQASGTKRRMDIYLEGEIQDKKYGICIENKPYASDQPEQIKDYAEELKRRKINHWHIVYLSEYKELPSENSITTEDLRELRDKNKFTSLKFGSLVEWLKACRLECQNNSVSEFLIQFSTFIERQFLGIESMSKSNAVLEIMKKNSSNIEASLVIQNNIERMKESFISDLVVQLKAKTAENKNSKVNVKYSKDHTRHGLITFATLNNVGFVCLEFDRPYNAPDLGFRFISEKEKDREDASKYIEKINKQLNDKIHDKNFKSSEWYPGYYSFEPYDWWDIETRPWDKISDGKMASKILNEVDRIVDALSDFL